MSTILMTVEQFLYDSWQYIGVIGLVAGMVSLLLTIINFKHPQGWAKKIICTSISLFILLIMLSSLCYYNFSKVPDLTNKLYSSAEIFAHNSGLDIELAENQTRDSSSVISKQTPDKNALIKKGATIAVSTCDTPLEPVSSSSDSIRVPQLIGMEQIEATSLLINIGLSFKVWWTERNNISSNKYYIIDQSIPESSVVPNGTLILLELSPSAP